MFGLSRSIAVLLVVLHTLVGAAGCASSSRLDNMDEKELQLEVATTYKAIPATYKPTGDTTADEALRGFWDEVKRRQPEIERARLAIESSRTVQLVRRSVDAHFKEAGIAKPTAAQRQEVEAQIIGYMSPAEQKEFAAARTAEKSKLDRDQAESLDGIVKLVKIGADVGIKIAAAKQSGAGGALAFASSAIGGASAADQLKPVTAYLDASEALFERYKSYFAAWDEQIERNMAKE